MSAQELVAKVDSLFAKVLELGPVGKHATTHDAGPQAASPMPCLCGASQDWYARFQAWAIRCLRSSVSLPVKDAAMLRAVLNCLASEGLLAHPDTTEVSRCMSRAHSSQPETQPTPLRLGHSHSSCVFMG